MSSKKRKKRRRSGPVHLPAARTLSPGSRIALAVGTTFLVCLFYLMGMNRTLELAARLERVQSECEAAERAVERLELELSAQLASERIVALARERLGLEFPAGGMETLAVLPEACGRSGDVGTYLKNAFAITLEGLERHLAPTAWARQTTLPDSGRGLQP